jgi:hypothetical protein
MLSHGLHIPVSLSRAFFDLELALADTRALLVQLEVGARGREVTSLDQRSSGLLRGLNRLSEFALGELRSAIAPPPLPRSPRLAN